MIACARLDPGPTGTCRSCGRPTAEYAGRRQHRRGRPGPPEPIPDYRALYAAALMALRAGPLPEVELGPDEAVGRIDPRLPEWYQALLRGERRRPPPLASWKAGRRLSGTTGWDGRTVAYPARAAAARGQSRR